MFIHVNYMGVGNILSNINVKHGERYFASSPVVTAHFK
jgi:hypothetical protein